MSSGNLTADRRFAYAQDLRRDGDFAAAADLILQALELAPDWIEGRFALGDTLMEAGQRDEAAAALRRYLEIDPDDSMGATIKLAQLGAAPLPPIMPKAFVTRLFDDYASRFDDALVKTLHYRAPELLRAAVETAAPGRRFTSMLDLGCGTGLAGVAFRPLTAHLEGVDLSPRMVAEAVAKGVYDSVVVNDILAHFSAINTTHDLVVAADVFVYIGDLAAVFAAVRKNMPNENDGLFTFSLQRSDTAETFTIGTERRYSHNRAYITALAAAHNFKVVTLENATVRQDRGADVPGLIVVLGA